MNVRLKSAGIVLAAALMLCSCRADREDNQEKSSATPQATLQTEVPSTGEAIKEEEASPAATAKVMVTASPKATQAPKEAGEEVTEIPQAEEADSKQASTNRKEEDYIVVKITHIDWTYFMAEAPWQSSIKYIIHAELGDRYCEGDYVEVSYEDIYELEENKYELDAVEVSESTYVSEGDADYKPVIYLYPKKETDVDVRLDYSGVITVSSPEYKDGWKVHAMPDGTLTGEDGRQYEYIFWEGIREMTYDLSEGFCISGEQTRAFLEEKLKYMGLNDQEIHDFIKFWIPYMKGNAYNLISFQGKAYTDNAKLTITPKPDSILRVYMVFKPLKEAVKVKEQKLTPFQRNGFTVVEWGGTIQ